MERQHSYADAHAKVTSRWRSRTVYDGVWVRGLWVTKGGGERNDKLCVLG
jgi:hypothetical protein